MYIYSQVGSIIIMYTWTKTQWCTSSVVSSAINVNVTPESTLITFILFSQQYASIRRQNTWLAGSSDFTKIQNCTFSVPPLEEKHFQFVRYYSVVAKTKHQTMYSTIHTSHEIFKNRPASTNTSPTQPTQIFCLNLGNVGR